VRRLTVREAAEYIPCGVSTLNRLRVTGGGPRYSKPPGLDRVFYDTEDLDAWIEAGKRNSDVPRALRRRRAKNAIAGTILGPRKLAV
jgi:hypothetical protein